jgi:hypothetical protein
MSEMPLDPFTADKLLSGQLVDEDVPVGYDGVAKLLQAAGEGPTHLELRRQSETVAAMSAVLGSRVGRSARRSGGRGMSRFAALKILAATLALLLTIGTGLALAGTLPDGFQKIASSVLAKIGISVANPNANADPNSNGAATEAPPEAALFGLCTAWESGQGGENGKKSDATAFQRLSLAAGTASLEDFCGGVIAQQKADHPTGQGNAVNGQANADEKSGGKSGGSSSNSHRP